MKYKVTGFEAGGSPDEKITAKHENLAFPYTPHPYTPKPTFKSGGYCKLRKIISVEIRSAFSDLLQDTSKIPLVIDSNC